MIKELTVNQASLKTLRAVILLVVSLHNIPLIRVRAVCESITNFITKLSKRCVYKVHIRYNTCMLAAVTLYIVQRL